MHSHERDISVCCVGEELEGECQASTFQRRVKSRKRQQRDSSANPKSPEVKVQKIANPESPEVKVQKMDEDGEDKVELSEDPMEMEGGCGLPTDGYWSHYQSLCRELPGREKQLELLLTLFGEVSPQRSYAFTCASITGLSLLSAGAVDSPQLNVHLWQQWYRKNTHSADTNEHSPSESIIITL